MDNEIGKAIKKLLDVIEGLRRFYPKKKFTLDGRLVGDLGEALIELAYDVNINEKQKKLHDGETSDGRLVQVKATVRNPKIICIQTSH